MEVLADNAVKDANWVPHGSKTVCLSLNPQASGSQCTHVNQYSLYINSSDVHAGPIGQFTSFEIIR